jgi:hypothetical protein
VASLPSPHPSVAETKPVPARLLPFAAWLLPSVADLLFAAILLGLCLIAPSRLLNDGGIGWHIRTGELILGGTGIPRLDPFSASFAGRPWFAWEWLFDKMAAALHFSWGLNGVVLLGALVIAVTFRGWFCRALQTSGSLLFALPATLLVFVVSSVHLLARPHVFSWLFTVLWWGILDRYLENGKQWQLVNLLPITALWANVHGGFVLGLALLLTCAAGAVVEALTKRGNERRAARRRVWQLGLWSVLCFLASLANPNGFSLHLHIYRYLTDRRLLAQIDEFRPPNLHWFAVQCFLVLLGLAVWMAWRRRSVLGVPRLLVFGLMAWSGLYAVRNLPLAAMIIAMIAARAVHGIGIDGVARNSGARARLAAWSARMTAVEFQLRGGLWSLAAVIFVFVLVQRGGEIRGHTLMAAHFDARRFPVGVTETLEQRGLSDIVFCPDAWGGYMIYRLWPQARLVVDDRHDFYGAEFLEQHVRVLRGEPGWQAWLDHQHADVLVLPANSGLVRELTREREFSWELLDADAVARVYVRRPPGFSQ